MSDFVYDNTDLPGAKTDAGDLTVPADQALSAAEFNTETQAMYDLRDAILAGDYHGLVEASAAVSASGKSRFRMKGGVVQVSQSTGMFREMLYPHVNLVDYFETYGGDKVGTADCAAAFEAAILSFSGSGSFAGTVVVPYGKYRLARAVSIKRGVHILGVQGNSPHLATWICPDAGIEAFRVEYVNTPVGTSDSGYGGGTTFEGIAIQPAGKVSAWATSATVTVGTRRRVGTGIGEDWRRHFECTTGGVTAGSGTGPSGFGYWVAATAYQVGDRRMSAAGGYKVYVCTAAGTSAASGGPTGTSTGITDGVGTLVWNYYGVPNIDSCQWIDGTAVWKYIGTGAGVNSRAQTFFRDVQIYSCSGSGWQNESASPEVGGLDTNCNYWGAVGLLMALNDGAGAFINGGNSNGGSMVGATFNANGSPTSDKVYTGIQFNLYESSSYGNYYGGCAFQSGGLGSVFCDNTGGGSVFEGCYEEGTGGGHNVATGSGCVVIGGGLGASSSGWRGAAASVNTTALLLGPSSTGQGFGQKIAGYGDLAWTTSTKMIVGARRVSGGNLYVVTGISSDALTAASGSGPISGGTGTGISDNHVTWDFVHAETPNGTIQFGSPDPVNQQAWYFQNPTDAAGVGFGEAYRHGSMGSCTDVHGHMYGTSGTGFNDSGAGIMHAVNDSKITEWPFHVPAGRALAEVMWIGGNRIFASTSTSDPAAGSYNPGDKMFYKAGACLAGGPLGKICVTGGTAGSYGGVRTATADGSTTVVISGAAMSTLKDQQDFRVGDKLTINSITARVTAVSSNGLSLTMSAGVTAGGSLAITFSNPVWQEFGRIYGGAGTSVASPGNATLNTQKGRSAFAALGAAVTITNNLVSATSIIGVALQTVDGTLTQILTVVPGSGSFVVTGNAAATGTTNFAWWIEQ